MLGLDVIEGCDHSLAGMEQHVRYDARGRRAPRWTARRILVVVLIVLIVLVLLQVVSYVVFNAGGTVPGSGEGEIVQ
jgi:t-SNARE complex subunit (syntaxin)